MNVRLCESCGDRSWEVHTVGPITGSCDACGVHGSCLSYDLDTAVAYAEDRVMERAQVAGDRLLQRARDPQAAATDLLLACVALAGLRQCQDAEEPVRKAVPLKRFTEPQPLTYLDKEGS